jgi:2-polyprenyl-6-hydroxyphenyl methylase/3-demethylubiquinone-9 3-methyltransferase
MGFVVGKIGGSSRVLELGCGYGRVLDRLAERAGFVLGVDTSRDSLQLAHRRAGPRMPYQLAQMNAIELAIKDRSFDTVVCIQNGISAFQVDKKRLMDEAVRVSLPGGRVVFSSYTERFWEHRLEWFRIQASHGLIGEIDWEATGDGVIVCKDGFRATTVGEREFVSLAATCSLTAAVTEVNGSSLFCELEIP